jgi:hypothetical protein
MILLGVGLSIFVIVVVHIVRSRRIPLPLDDGATNEEVTTNASFSLLDLLEMRFSQGIKASQDYARSYEMNVLMTLSSFEDQQLAESSSFYGQNKRTVTMLQRYLDFYTKAGALRTEDDIRSFLSELSSTLEGEQIPPIVVIYEILCSLSTVLETSDFIAALKVLSSNKSKIAGFKSKHYVVNQLFKTLARLSKEVDSNLQLMSADLLIRRKAVADVQTSITDCYHKISGNSAGTTDGMYHLPEMKFLIDILGKLKALARKHEVEISEKPKFHISLHPVRDTLIVDNELISLQFLIRNLKHNEIQVDRINIYPISCSNDIQYKGDSRDLRMKGDSMLVSFMFHTYILHETLFDKYPSITFKLKYWIREEEGADNVDLQLPEVAISHRISNPFQNGTIGSGLPGDSPLFVGRHNLLSSISTNLLDFDSAPVYYLIHGLTRTGKSSVLNQLEENPSWLKRKYIPVKISSQTSQQVGSFFKVLYETLKDKISDMGIRPHLPEKRLLDDTKAPGWQPLQELIRLNEKDISKLRKRILLLVDEYQNLAMSDQKDDGLHSVRREFPEFIKILRDDYGEVITVILAGHQTLQQVARVNYHWVQQLGGRVTPVQITNFLEDDADQLILSNFDRHRLEVSKECLKRIRTYTHCHPFLHMLMGFYVFERFVENNNYRLNRSVTAEDIDHAARQIKADQMKFIWADPGIVSDAESSILVAAIGEISYNEARQAGDFIAMPYITIDQVKNHLYLVHNVQYTQYAYDYAPANLCSYGIIEKSDHGEKYRLSYPIFSISAHRENMLREILAAIRNASRREI